MKKLVLFMGVLVIGFSFFLYFYFSPKNYSEEYKLKDFDIIEEFHKDEKLYYFVINEKYDFVVNEKYSINRQKITKIDYKDNCITPYFEKTKLNEICYIEGDINYNVITSEEKDSGTFDLNGIKLYGNPDIIYTIWNYNSVLIVENRAITKIDLFKESVYRNELTVLVDNLLIMPNYDQKYDYTEFLILNVTNQKLKTWKIDYEISNDSYILGIYDNKIYLVDRKYKIEYEINPVKEKIEVVGNTTKLGIIYNNGFEELTMNKLIKNDLSFNFKETYNYKMNNEMLFLNYYDKDILTKVSDFKNGYIVKQTNDNLYYLINDNLYVYSPFSGNKRLLQYFEWNFNYKNLIFIYNK